MFYEEIEKPITKAEIIKLNLVTSMIANTDNIRVIEYCKELIKKQFNLEWTNEMDLS